MIVAGKLDLLLLDRRREQSQVAGHDQNYDLISTATQFPNLSVNFSSFLNAFIFNFIGSRK